MEVEVYKTDNIIFVEDGKVRIIVKGKAVLNGHDPDILLPKTIQTLFPGDIIGYTPIDNGNSKKLDTWIMSKENMEDDDIKSGATEILSISEKFFEFMWDQ